MSNFQFFHSDDAPKAVGPYSQAVAPRIPGRPIYLSGQLGIDPVDGVLKEGIEAQTKQVFANIKAVLKVCGLELSDVLSVDVLLVNIGDYGLVNQVYAQEFGEHKPARAAYEVRALPLGALIEIKVTAWGGGEC